MENTGCLPGIVLAASSFCYAGVFISSDALHRSMQY
jgi:hypothetical protein